MKRKFLLFRSVLLTLLLLLGAQGATAANYIKGSWDSWHDTYATDASGNVSIDLAAETTYQFKLLDTGTSGTANNWYSNSGTMTSTNCTGWTFSTEVGGDAQITTTVAGTYTFHVTWSGSTPTISVTYPSAGPVPPVATDLYMWYQIEGGTWTATTSKLTTDASGIGHYTITGDDSNKDKKLYVTFSKSSTVDWANPWRCSSDTPISPSTEYTKGTGDAVWYIAALEKGYNYTFNVDEANSKFTYDKTRVGPSVAFSQASGSTLPKPTSITVTLTGEADGKTYTLHVTKAALSRSSVFPKEESFVMSVASVSHIIDLDEVGVYTFTLKNDADETLATATYTVEEQYDITLSAEAGKGTVSPSGTVKVGSAAVTISAMAASGYQFKQWTTTGGVTVANAASATTTITATSDGTIKALFEDYVAPDMSYYLVGNFFDDDGDDIKYNRRYFKFNIQKDGRYMVELPAAVTAKAQIIGVTDVVTKFGPSTATYNLSAAHPTTDLSATGTFAAANTTNYWNLTTRNDNTAQGDDDGLYEVWFTAGADGTPTNWEFKHVSTRRVAYFLSNATGATVNPVYNERHDASAAFSNKTYAMVYIDPNQSYYTIGYVLRDKEWDYINKANTTGAYGAHVNNKCQDVLPTTNKLFLMGNNGRVFEDHPPYNEVSPHVAPIQVNKVKGLYKVEYNPSNGNNEWAKGAGSDQPNDEKNTVGIRGQIIFKSGGEDDPIFSISMVGNAIPGTTDSDGKWIWDSTVGDMAYDENDGCYKLTFTTTADESVENRFRFVANHNKNMTWYEDGTTDDKKAHVPYLETGSGHSCLPTDPNPVSYTVTDNTDYTDVNIIFNRPAGTWTVRFYIDINEQGQKSYRYTIDGSKGFDFPIYGGRVLCSFSSHKSLNIPAHFRAYVAHSFAPKEAGDDNTNDGHVNLYRIKYIPANVGVILYGDDPKHNYTTVTVPFTEYTGEDVTGTPALWYYPEKHTDETFNNFLVAAPDGEVLSTNGRLDTRSEYYDEETHTYKYYVYLSRYFAFTWFSKTLYANYYNWTDHDMAPKTGELKFKPTFGFPDEITDYASFYRAKGTVGKNRAYLVLPAEIMGYSGQALSQTQDETDPDGKPLFSKSGLRFEDFYYEDYSDEFSTAIQPIVNVANGNKDNTFYNIQGMKVANPTKGLYIINGKKMIVK